MKKLISICLTVMVSLLFAACATVRLLSQTKIKLRLKVQHRQTAVQIR